MTFVNPEKVPDDWHPRPPSKKVMTVHHANGKPYVQRSPRFNHKPIPLERVANESKINKVGDFCWKHADGDKMVFVVAIPHLNVRGWIMSEWTIGHKNEWGAEWTWDGNVDMPTIKPSLHALGVWHGNVDEGQLVEASGL